MFCHPTHQLRIFHLRIYNLILVVEYIFETLSLNLVKEQCFMFCPIILNWFIPCGHVLLSQSLDDVFLFAVSPPVEHILSMQFTMSILNLLKLIELFPRKLNEPSHNDYINIMEGVLKEESSNVLPSIHSHEAELRGVFKLVTGKDRTWGLEAYEVNKVYEDPIKLKEERLRQSGSPGKKVYITKKGHYLDNLLRMNKIPGPGTYKFPNAWLDNSGAKKRMTSERKTYLDWIFSTEKKNNYPAPNVYDVVETEEEKKARLAKMNKKNSTSCTKLNFIDTC